MTENVAYCDKHVSSQKCIFCSDFTLQFIHLHIQDLILASNEFKGIDNPLSRVGCKYFLLCVQVLFTRLCVILLLVR